MSPRPATAYSAPGHHAVPGNDPGPRRARAPLRWLVVLTALAVVVTLLRVLAVEPFRITSDSMRPTLAAGDRVLVEKLRATAVSRGEVVVLDGARLFGSPGHYAKRVIALPGDRVACCDPQGRLTVNGTALNEPYLGAGEAPSELAFDVQVPAERVWVMGDHRSRSVDSRSRLGDPGGGMLPLQDIVGRVMFRLWPLGDMGTVGATGSPAGGYGVPAVAA